MAFEAIASDVLRTSQIFELLTPYLEVEGEDHLSMTCTFRINPEMNQAEFDSLPDVIYVWIIMEAERTYPYNVLSSHLYDTIYKESLPVFLTYTYTQKTRNLPVEGSYSCRFSVTLDDKGNSDETVTRDHNDCLHWLRKIDIVTTGDPIGPVELPVGETNMIYCKSRMWWNFQTETTDTVLEPVIDFDTSGNVVLTGDSVEVFIDTTYLQIIGSGIYTDYMFDQAAGVFNPEWYNLFPDSAIFQCEINAESIELPKSRYEPWQFNSTKKEVMGKNQIYQKKGNNSSLRTTWDVDLKNEQVSTFPLNMPIYWSFHYTISDATLVVPIYDFTCEFKTNSLMVPYSVIRSNDAVITNVLSKYVEIECDQD